MLSVLLFSFCACAVVNKWDGVSQAKELQKTGQPAEATVVQIWDTGMTVNNDPVIGLLLEVHPTNGEAYQTKTKALVSRVHIPQFQPGAVLPVRVDPKDPNRVSVDVYQY
ncbi:MAG: hypothetical protein C5B54_12230 [Acidobacteria bacterium]|nr:MAG: hypothetical protein C5B54_12230 [Acidobacteriota bacterium]